MLGKLLVSTLPALLSNTQELTEEAVKQTARQWIWFQSSEATDSEVQEKPRNQPS